MKEGAVTLNEEGTILYCNHSFEELMCVPMEQIVGSNFARFISKNKMSAFDRLLHKKTQARLTFEIVYFACNETRKYLLLSFCPMPDDALGKICIIVSDITELKKFQHDLQLLVDERTCELEKANQQLKETNATKDRLFSIIAHDLRGPFTAILGFSELLVGNSRSYDTGQFEMMINNIHSAAKNAFELLENLLLWAMAQKKQLQFNPEVTDLTLILKEITKSLKTVAAIKNISIICIPNEAIAVYVDVNMLKTIVRNLISNSIKFTNQGGLIGISAFSNAETVEITVTDNGVGMDEETKKGLFKIETLKTSVGTAQEKGSGLGLMICKEFIELHGGRLLIESQPGRGSSFTVIFPQKEMSFNEVRFEKREDY
jgi:PAS domain S-box-containing protein